MIVRVKNPWAKKMGKYQSKIMSIPQKSALCVEKHAEKRVFSLIFGDILTIFVSELF